VAPTKRRSIALLQTLAPDYRRPVFAELEAATKGDFHLYSGLEYFDETVKAAPQVVDHTAVRNRFLLGRRLSWQTGMWLPLLKADVAILEFNPRILSNWGLLLARRVLGKRTVLWGHAWPRRGRRTRSLPIRHAMVMLADGLLVYTESQARELRQVLPKVRITPAPNALYKRSDMLGDSSLTEPSPATDFIYVGRLVEAKKPGLLLEAYRRAAERLPTTCRLVFVGDGPLRSELEQSTAELGSRVHFAGHVSDFETLRGLYGRSLASVSPGYVGLSITQSFAFGVPMLIARNEPHAPEIEAAIEGANAAFFNESDADALAQLLVETWQQRDTWLKRRNEIRRDCAERYSVELMAARMLSACFPDEDGDFRGHADERATAA
jgi:glycosyltransferase involved in cell wall biosynthesis